MSAPTPVAATLRAARARISEPARWTQTAYARTRQGESTSPTDPQAVCWCATGAIIAVTGEDTELGGAAVRAIVPYAHNLLSTFNDTHTHADVLALFDRAIAAAEETQP